MYYRETAFKINLKKGTHKLTHILSTNQGDSQLYNPHHFRMDWVPLRVKGRKYFTNAPLLFRYFQALGAVYVYNERTKSVRFAAAFGQASRFGYLNNDAGKKYLQEKGKDINKQFFMWSDMNGNGKVDLTEVKFKERKADNRYGFIGRFDHELGAMGYNLRFEVDRFLRDGTPIYRERKMPFKAIYKFPSGIYVNFNGNAYGKSANEGYDAKGKRLWFYHAFYDISGLDAGPWRPGYCTNQFGISGVGKTHVGDLGEFFVTHANNGQMNIWSTDGLLAGHITLHQRDPRAKRLGGAFKKGTRYDGLTLGQEHFHHNFGQTTDNRYFFVGGGDILGLFEVKGWEKFKRIGGTINITSAVLKGKGSAKVTRSTVTKPTEATGTKGKGAKVIRSPVARPAKAAGTSVIKASFLKNAVVDGSGREYAQDWVWIRRLARFKMGYDAKNLYLLWQTRGAGPLKNIGDDYRRYFKTGASVDVMLSTNPAARHSRNKPVAGDIRILVTYVEGKPVAVLYRPIALGARRSEAWKVSTPAGGVASFQQVKILKGVTIKAVRGKNKYNVEMAVPRKAIGLKNVRRGLKLRMDWGVISTTEGNLSIARDYWANKQAVGVTDEPTEARLQPKNWGYVKFQ